MTVEICILGGTAGEYKPVETYELDIFPPPTIIIITTPQSAEDRSY